MFQAIILTPKFNICYYIQSVYVTTNPAFPWQQKRSTTTTTTTTTTITFFSQENWTSI